MKYLWNPLPNEVSTQYAGVTYTLPAEKITTIEDPTIFRHMRDYLTTLILNERGLWHFDSEREKVHTEIVKEL